MPDDRLSLRSDDRCVVSLTFDNFGESYDLLQYGHAGGAFADGVYAPRRGVPRIMDLLDRNGIRASFFMEGWNVRKYPDLVREVIARGHEVGAHGWMHEAWSSLDLGQERELVERTTHAIAETTGYAPKGWRSPGGLVTPNTLSVLDEYGYVYDSSFADEDIPYLLQTAPGSDRTIAELPWQWVLDDAMYYSPKLTVRRVDDVAQIWVDEFDAAYRTTGYFMLVCHPRYSGRPARLQALEKLISHIQSHEGVRFVRCNELVEELPTVVGVPQYPAPARRAD